MHLLILGGSHDHLGGVEAFCDRSKVALERRVDWTISRQPTSTAYLTIRRIPVLLRGLAALVSWRSKGVDVVWLSYVTLPDLAFLVVAKFLGFKVMVTPHLGSNWRSQSNPLLRALSGSALRLADRLALISPTQELEINLPKRVPRSHIRNFLPEEILTAALPDKSVAQSDVQLIHSARLSEDKGTFMVVEVSARLRAAGVPFTTRITGGADPETYAQLSALIAKHGLGDQVKVLGRVPEEELLGHLRGSDVLIHLSRIDSYPLIVLEAIACAMLPVAMELAGARDMIETYGGQVVSKSEPVTESADWISSLDLAAVRKQARLAASRVRADYAWARCAGALEAALRACNAGDRVTVTRPEPTLQL